MKKIVIIEDQELSYDSLMGLLNEELSAEEYEVVDAGITISVEEAVIKITEIKPDFILLDMNLGEDVCEPEDAVRCDGTKILQQTNFCQSQIICTSSSSEKYKPFLRAAGINIHHPPKWWVDPDVLIKCIKAQCGC